MIKCVLADHATDISASISKQWVAIITCTWYTKLQHIILQLRMSRWDFHSSLLYFLQQVLSFSYLTSLPFTTVLNDFFHQCFPTSPPLINSQLQILHWPPHKLSVDTKALKAKSSVSKCWPDRFSSSFCRSRSDHTKCSPKPCTGQHLALLCLRGIFPLLDSRKITKSGSECGDEPAGSLSSARLCKERVSCKSSSLFLHLPKSILLLQHMCKQGIQNEKCWIPKLWWTDF